jgi:hypothetical protein
MLTHTKYMIQKTIIVMDLTGWRRMMKLLGMAIVMILELGYTIQE